MANVLVGVCGGISAYKTCEFVRELQKRNVNVRVVMTVAAQQFVTKLTFESLTGSQVYTDLFGDGAFGTAHIEMARWADLFVIAPATANTIAKLSHGSADDFLSTAYLAFRGPTLLAPAMNTAMWEHDAVQKNMTTLKTRGVGVVNPAFGELACGEIGAGKMADPKVIADAVVVMLKLPHSTLAGKNVLITAGPTREYVDPVRYLSNPSTGKMGLAVAREAVRRGANVTLIHGPMELSDEPHIRKVAVTTAQEMADAVGAEKEFDIFVGTAAVSDYRPVTFSDSKIKKQEDRNSLQLEKTEDILESISRRKRPGNILIGFAAETENVVDNARKKLKAKNLDLVVANPVYKEQKGFVQDQTDVVFIDRSEKIEKWDQTSKADVAFHLWDHVEKMYESHS